MAYKLPTHNTSGVCVLNAEARDEIKRIDASREPYAIVLKCNLGTKELVVDYTLDASEAVAEDMVDELSGVHRLVLYKCAWKIPQDTCNRVEPVTILIWFNPAESTDVNIKKTYGSSAERLTVEYEWLKQFQINNAQEDFHKKWFAARNYTYLGEKGQILMNEQARTHAPTYINCTNENDGPAKFCAECGTPRESLQDSYCSECGHKL